MEGDAAKILPRLRQVLHEQWQKGPPPGFLAVVTKSEILAAARLRGLIDPRISCDGCFGYSLHGDGSCTDDWPLVWSVARDLGISRGGGRGGWHQIAVPDDEKLREVEAG